MGLGGCGRDQIHVLVFGICLDSGKQLLYGIRLGLFPGIKCRIERTALAVMVR